MPTLSSSSSSSNSYEEYEREYKSHLAKVRSYLANTSHQRDIQTLQQCDTILQQAKQCATAMMAISEMDGNPLQIHEAKQLLIRDIHPLSKEIQRTIQSMRHESNYNELLSSSLTTSTSTTSAARNSTYQPPRNTYDNTDIEIDALINNSNDMLLESQSILQETESIGTMTIQQMVQQRQQLTHTQQTFQSLQIAMSQSQHILQTMSRRACRNRLFLYMSIGTLLLLNLYVLFCIYQKHHSKSSSSS